MAALLAVDAGTTGVRALVVHDDGTVAARGYREFPQSFPRSGWVEHDPEDWWSALAGATAEALAASSLHARDLVAVGITNQRETAVVWHRATLEPVHPAGRTGARPNAAPSSPRRDGRSRYGTEPA
jgi:glycerol kinase